MGVTTTSWSLFKAYTRTMHAHDASRHAAPVRMCALRMQAGRPWSLRTTTVESNMEVSIIYTWLVKTLHSMLSSFALFLVLVLPS